MKQISEDYCSFEVAKLLKEKGFDELSTVFYDEDGTDLIELYDYEPLRNSELSGYAKVTQSLALKWLREVHNYYIQIMLDSWACGGHLGYYVVIQKTDSDFEIMLQDAVDEVFYQTYEEACEAALKYTLENLI